MHGSTPADAKETARRRAGSEARESPQPSRFDERLCRMKAAGALAQHRAVLDRSASVHPPPFHEALGGLGPCRYAPEADRQTAGTQRRAGARQRVPGSYCVPRRNRGVGSGSCTPCRRDRVGCAGTDAVEQPHPQCRAGHGQPDSVRGAAARTGLSGRHHRLPGFSGQCQSSRSTRVYTRDGHPADQPGRVPAPGRTARTASSASGPRACTRGTSVPGGRGGGRHQGHPRCTIGREC